ncbi:hypothetical protein [Streptomyces liangshanensis]|uniref:Uncharacterized protein n=1 Tax=Streptomyces liangshanensis TaxID=2717324 RepID=A0A6G9GTG2_9ACTN|nr:hypothetical protein [Streptomyces liangshanensis]QIQ01538.1 hypothetical protein HA039_03830 [Streptomyces liangshanensis]
MCSNLLEPVHPQLRVRNKFGAVLTASVATFAVEVAIGMIALAMWRQTQESPGFPYNGFTLFILIIVAPFLAVVGAALGALLTVGLVMPLLVGAGWLGRGLSGREAWWWVPALAAAGAAALTALAAVPTGDSLLPVLGGWLVVTAALSAPALVARRLLLPDRPPLSGGVMFGRVVLYGTLVVVTAGSLAGIGTYAGIVHAYEPPRLNTQRAAGTWTDGDGGTLVLTADGHATATRIKTFDIVDSGTVTHRCTGTGTWNFDPGDGPWAQEIPVSVDNCSMDNWAVSGTPEHPKLFVYIGDPDSWDLYILQRPRHR